MKNLLKNNHILFLPNIVVTKHKLTANALSPPI